MMDAGTNIYWRKIGRSDRRCCYPMCNRPATRERVFLPRLYVARDGTEQTTNGGGLPYCLHHRRLRFSDEPGALGA